MRIHKPKIVDLSGNLISDWPQPQNDSFEEKYSTEVESLILNGNKLNTLNMQAVNESFSKLIKLDLRSNNILFISQFAALPILEVLDLGCNQLTRVPAKFFESVPNLSQLYLDNNQIEFLPPELCDLTSLKHLAIQLNHFSYIPASLFYLDLESLGLEWFNYLEPQIRSPFPPKNAPSDTMTTLLLLARRMCELD